MAIGHWQPAPTTAQPGSLWQGESATFGTLGLRTSLEVMTRTDRTSTYPDEQRRGGSHIGHVSRPLSI